MIVCGDAEVASWPFEATWRPDLTAIAVNYKRPDLIAVEVRAHLVRGKRTIFHLLFGDVGGNVDLVTHLAGDLDDHRHVVHLREHGIGRRPVCALDTFTAGLVEQWDRILRVTIAEGP